MKICCIFGTRPEVIKMAPVIHQLLKFPQIKTHVVCSGQHRELLYPLIDWFNLKIDMNLDLMQENQDLNTLSSRVIAEMGKLLQREKYDLIIAQGDTTTVLMSAMAAFHTKTPFAHVEAGLRTFDYHFPYPEEMNRVLVGKIASLHFCPTQTAVNHLKQEHIPEESIFFTGNTVIDALYYTTRKLNLDNKPSENHKTILVTAHRRENFGKPLERICSALSKIAMNHPEFNIIFPVHPNPNVRAIVHPKLSHIANIQLIEPLPYNELVSVLANAYLVLTDSGGIQEEAPALKKPVLVLRDETERPEVVALGGAKLVGSDEELIIHTVESLLSNHDEYQRMIIGYSPYGSGDSAEKIVEKILDMSNVSVQEVLDVARNRQI